MFLNELEEILDVIEPAEFQKVMAANPPQSRDLRVYETDEGQPLG